MNTSCKIYRQKCNLCKVCVFNAKMYLNSGKLKCKLCEILTAYVVTMPK